MLLSNVCLSDVCLSRTSGQVENREAYRKSRIGTEVAHVTRDSDTTFKVKRSKVKVTRPLCSPTRLCSGGRENVLAVGNCCYVAVCSAAQSASAPTGGGEGRGHTVAAARLQLVEPCCPAQVVLLSLFLLYASFFLLT